MFKTLIGKAFYEVYSNKIFDCYKKKKKKSWISSSHKLRINWALSNSLINIQHLIFSQLDLNTAVLET